MTCVRLPIAMPPIIGYLHHAYPLAILAQNDAYRSWFHCHYIQLHCPDNFAEGPDPQRKNKFNFYRPPDYDTACSPRLSLAYLKRETLLDTPQDLGSVVRRTLDTQTYIQLCIDEYHIPGKAAFQKRHLLHEILIYGYDDATETVETLGYNARGDFAPQPVAIAHLTRAISGLRLETHYDPDGICFFRYAPEAPCHFDLELLIDTLEDYLYARDTSERFRMLGPPIGGVFGVKTYECLIAHCKSLHHHPARFDIRPIHILWEHKKCMLERIRYLETHGYLDPADGFARAYAPLEACVRTARMMMLKLRVSKNFDILDRILDRIASLAETEPNLLACLRETLCAAPSPTKRTIVAGSPCR